jgi:predicted ABC-type transport system involved in lysophospholipase L1 biosynthesis ATPase subunit
MTDAVLATGISKTFKTANAETSVLQEVSFCVERGSSVALLGGARSGKTTLINLLAGLEPPSSGSLEVFGRKLAHLTEAEKATYRREVVGLVSPEVPWLPQFSLEDNVALPLLLTNVPRREAEGRVAEMSAWLELPRNATLKTLTPLEQQRWALARGLIHAPKLLLVDGLETLDNEAEVFADYLLEKTSDLEVTILFTTRQPLVAAHAGQIFTLRGSRLQVSREGRVQRCGD